MKSMAIMVQGTTSDAGKSVLVAGLCRYLARKGFRVAPFKPQNMALNSAVTEDGGEIGRAQAVQAQAAGITPTVHMNPVLLKPSTDQQAQVIVQGKVHDQFGAAGYQDYKNRLLPFVLQSFAQLQKEYDIVVIEGAGSPAEINLRHNDIANMGFAEAVDCPVILIADIDRGGVFAHLVGTLDLLATTEQKRILGFVINKFRGDLGLLQPGLDWLTERTGKYLYGVLPYIHGLHIEAEDAIQAQNQGDQIELTVVVPVLPRISNHTDFDALRLHPAVNLVFVGPNQAHPPADLIILPGSKSVMTDLNWLRESGWHKTIERHLRFGGKVLGICGGYQMLGAHIADPNGVESPCLEMVGLSWLPISTSMAQEKTLTRVQGELFFQHPELPSAKANGYEIHMGQTQLVEACDSTDYLSVLRTETGSEDGLMSPCGQIIGTYWHGIFDHPEALTALLKWAGVASSNEFDYIAVREAAFDKLADTLAQHMDTDGLLRHVDQFYADRTQA